MSRLRQKHVAQLKLGFGSNARRVALCSSVIISLIAVSMAGSSVHASSYGNPRTYRISYTATIVNIDSTMDRVQIYLPLPREWESQKNVQIESVTPKPNSINVETEYGSKMAYFELYDVRPGQSREFTAQYTFTFYETHMTIDPSKIGSYNKSDPEYIKFSAHRPHENIESNDPLIQNAAAEIVRGAENAYFKARRIYDWIVANIEYRFPAGWGAKDTYLKKGGDCGCYTALFCAMCISEGIPARPVSGLIFRDSLYKQAYSSKGNPTDPAAYGCHVYAEFYLPEYGWVPADGSIGRSSRRPDQYFGETRDPFLINSKGFGIWTVPPVRKLMYFQHCAWWFWGTVGKYDSYYSYTVETISTTSSVTGTPTATTDSTTQARTMSTTSPAKTQTTTTATQTGSLETLPHSNITYIVITVIIVGSALGLVVKRKHARRVVPKLACLY